MDKESRAQNFSLDFTRWIFTVVLIPALFIPLSLDQNQNRELLSLLKPTNPRTAISAPPIPPKQQAAASKNLKPAIVVEKPKNSSASPSSNKQEDLFNSIILEAAKRHQVEPALVKAIIMAESGYNPKAITPKGALGLMQLMPKTAKTLGVEDGFDPKHNINGGVRYFRQLLNQFGGNVKLALAAYNAGSRKVRQYQGIPPFKSTQYYIERVIKYYQDYKKQMASA